ncbi:MAG TPA: flagellar filament capping protein FliD, partial [Cellvibrionaceae bacterium]
ANVGVQASIVSDGSDYRLLLSGPSGANNELELSVAEDPLAPGLSTFNFNESSQVLAQQQEGRDALIRLNGLLLSRDSNRVTDVIEGLEFDIFNSNPGETINITISADRATAEQAIRDFVEAYNTFLGEVEKLTGFDNELQDFGSLRNDSLAKNLVQSVRSYLGANVAGLEEGFTSLANLGIRTNRDGTLDIDEDPSRANTNFRAAMDNHFEKVRDLFVPTTQSSDSRVAINGFSNRTQAGSYEVVITQHAEKGEFIADPVALTFPLDTIGKDYSFEVQVDGKNSATISLPPSKIYNTGAELAADFQAMINIDPTLQDAGVDVEVVFNTDTSALEFTSNSYGLNSIVSFTNVGADMADLGVNTGVGQAGANVAGTIDGVAGFGFGNVLLPALRTPAEGMGLTIAPGVTNATISFSRGLSGGLTNIVNSFLASNGLIKGREDNIKDGLEKVVDDRASLDRRTEAYRLRLENQFMAMEMIVRSLNNTGTFLDGILDRLPFTASKK